jgi:hypothetical protein
VLEGDCGKGSSYMARVVRALQVLRRVAPLAGALLLVLLFRLPPLLNANALNSDAAIVGVQARHLLEGEFALRLWGSPYQAPLDALLAAVLFAFGGSSAFLLLLVPLLGMMVMVALAYDVIEPRAGRLGALLALTPLLFATQAINSPMTYVLRQSLATWAVLAVWCFERAPERSRPERWFALGGALVGLGLYLDTFFAVLLPPLVLFAAIRAWNAPARTRAMAAFAIPLALGLALSVALLIGAPPSGSSLTSHHLARNGAMLWSQCLPFALATKVWLPGSVEWVAPLAVHVLQVIAAVLFGGALLSGAVAGVRTRTHALGLLGVFAALAALGGFLFSSAPFDMWSTRYLAPMLWFAPFALTPLVTRVGTARSALLIGPWALSALVSGWVSYGEFVEGPSVVRTERGRADDEAALGQVLRDRGVHHGRAQYWQAYRLSLLWREDPLVVPLEADLDRFAPARAKVDAAPKVALIFHPSEPRASAADFEAGLVAEGARYERLETEGFIVLIVRN